ncbi:hypothetical protein EDC96DRAFT_602130 [Choanephora cucurbitarum]|nr:hypothetical protein EDC96DRAFT_602130 [Choanephora cucurbitarum]
MTIVNELQPFEQSFSVTLDDDVHEKEKPSYLSSPNDMTGTSDYLLETFHQYPHGDFRPTFYNPFEIKHRRRTSRTQLKVLEKSFSENSKPNANARRMLAQKLDMTPRGVQIWFQNRRAKAKTLKKKIKHNGCHRQQIKATKKAEETEEDDYEEDDLSLNEDEFTERADPRQQPMHRSSYEEECSDVIDAQLEFPCHVSPIDMSSSDPSSILFSQFFSDPLEFDYAYPPPPPSSWLWTNHDNVRTVATKAAAIAAASSFQTNSMPISVPSWINDSSDKRRRSCPMPVKDMMPTNQVFVNRQTTPILSFSSSPWPPSLKDTHVGTKRSLSFSQQQNLDYYYSKDTNLTYQQEQLSFQLTPPLTASCSASTVAGSPISLDSLYHEPMIQQGNLICPPNANLSHPLIHSFYEI